MYEAGLSNSHSLVVYVSAHMSEAQDRPEQTDDHDSPTGTVWESGSARDADSVAESRLTISPEEARLARLRESAKRFPTKPGVYLMRNNEDTIIYVGKAKNLRNRVRSYFTGRKDVKTRVLVTHIEDINHIVCSNEYEALLLENSLIKEHKPRYNINLKDGKTYPVIRITNEEFPRVFRTRRVVQDGSEYFGPYPDVHALDTYLELIERLFPLRKCRGPIKKREHPCLYYHINRCVAPCAGKINQEDYQAQVDRIRRLLSGDVDQMVTELHQEMQKAGEELRFERAATIRDSIVAIERLKERQQVVDFDPDARDYISMKEDNGPCSIVVFQMRAGRLAGSESFFTNAVEERPDTLQEFILQYYEGLRTPPARLFVDADVQIEWLQSYFMDQHGVPVQVVTSYEGRDGAVMRMVQENASQDLERHLREKGNIPALEELQKVLELDDLPLRIEGFDIAQLSGKHTVASLISFLNGVPDKSNYRTFGIRSLEGQIDDFEAMREAVARRYTRVINERLPKPHLILIDGGKGQVSAARSVLDSLGLQKVPVVGLAKRNEELFLPGKSDPVVLPAGSPPLRVLQFVRDEAHRFATNHNQRLRSKDVGLSTLESVPGIGPKRAARILKAFESLDRIAEVPPDVLAKTCSLTEEVARNLVAHVRSSL